MNATPERIKATVWGWSRDVNGNPTAFYRLDWAGGEFEAKRRGQVGYRDKVSSAARSKAHDLFPQDSSWGWEVGPEGIDGDRSTGRAEFHLYPVKLEA